MQTQRSLSTAQIVSSLRPENHPENNLRAKGTAADQGDRTVHGLFEAQVRSTPGAIALTHHGRSLTYEALNRRANQLAHWLLGHGVGANQLVAISVRRSLDMVVAFLGVLKAGAAYVPIDPDYPEMRRRYILTDAQTQVVLTESALAGEFAGLPQVLCLDTDWAAGLSAENPNLTVTPADLTYVIYTSGSTGNPKGVMAQHRGVASYTQAMAAALGLTAADRMLQFSTMSFDMIVSEIYPTLMSGGTLVLRSDAMATSVRDFLAFIAAEEITVIQFTTAFWHELVNGLVQLQARLPESLRVLLFGGEKASLAACRQWFSHVGSYPRLINGYGPTETTVIATIYDTQAEGYDATTDIPIGRPIGEAKTYVLDEALRPVAAGEPGELYIGGPVVTQGYLNLPEKTALAFVPSPFAPPDALPDAPRERLYKTGDMVRLSADGLLEFIGRVDFQVKIRGFRIELSEVEAALDEYLPLQQKIVVAREDPSGSKQLVAYVVMQPNEVLDLADLRQFLSDRLPQFMIPAAVVVLPALPTTINGKIDRQALPAPVQEPHRVTPPRTDLERQLVSVWQQVLGVPVGVTDNFFELGGHSLLVVRCVTQMEILLGRAIAAADLLDAPTIEQLATRLGQMDPPTGSANGPASGLVTLKAGATPPLFLIHDADGDTGLYLHLARKLDRAVYAVLPEGAAAVPLIHSDIATMAAACVRQMRAAQPQGPYRVGGLCAGGIIAAEVVAQLEQAGEAVALLALLDAPEVRTIKTLKPPQQRRSRFTQVWQATPAGQRLQLAGQKLGGLLRYELGDRAYRANIWTRIQTLRLCRRLGWPLPQGIPVRSLILFACDRHAPAGQIQAPTVLFRATQGDGTLADVPYRDLCADPLLGWQARVRLPVQVYDVPGGHSTMLSADHAGAIAQVISTF